MHLDRHLFVTGTDTGVGKSAVTAALAAAAARTGVPVRALKPVASGVPEGEAGEDAELLGLAAGHAPLSRYRFRAPLSPHRAAAMDGAEVDPREVRTWIEANLGALTLVEGAGGWEVPLAPRWRVSDLAKDLGWPVLIVARDRLGVLNQTLLTVAAVERAGLLVAGVVLTPESVDQRTANAEDLASLLPGVAIRRMGWMPGWTREELAGAGAALLAG